jgi:hypothetical protein
MKGAPTQEVSSPVQETWGGHVGTSRRILRTQMGGAGWELVACFPGCGEQAAQLKSSPTQGHVQWGRDNSTACAERAAG